MTELAHLERSLDALTDSLARPELQVDSRRRLSRLRDDVASHVLAARLLVTSGAGDDTVRPVLRRAAALLDEERRLGSRSA